MNTLVTIAIVVVVVLIVLAVAGSVMARRRRSEGLRERFGPEYDRTVDEFGDTQAAEPILLAREKRVKRLDIHPLSDEDRTRFSDEWTSVQAQFVDDPTGAVADADHLVSEVMEARGYPVGDFEERTADISVDHADVVDNFRAAHEIALRQARGEASTEDLRQAMVHYRSLFESLLGDSYSPTAREQSVEAQQ